MSRSHIFDEFYAAVTKLAEKEYGRVPRDFDEYPWFKWMIDNPKGTTKDAFIDWQLSVI